MTHGSRGIFVCNIETGKAEQLGLWQWEHKVVTDRKQRLLSRTRGGIVFKVPLFVTHFSNQVPHAKCFTALKIAS